MSRDLWERAAHIVCVADLAQAAGIEEADFAAELRKRYPTEDKLRAMWARTTENMPLLRNALAEDMPLTCPHCGRLNEAHSGVNTPNKPRTGDALLCIGCGEWAIFESDHARKPDDREAADLANDPTCIRVREAWLATVETHGRPPHVGRH